MRYIGLDGSVPNPASRSKAHLTSRGDGNREKKEAELCISEQCSLNLEGRDETQERERKPVACLTACCGVLLVSSQGGRDHTPPRSLVLQSL